MADKAIPEDWAIRLVLFYLALKFAMDGAVFLWWSLPAPMQSVCRKAGNWLVINRIARYMVLGVLLTLGLAAGLALIRRYLL